MTGFCLNPDFEISRYKSAPTCPLRTFTFWRGQLLFSQTCNTCLTPKWGNIRNVIFGYWNHNLNHNSNGFCPLETIDMEKISFHRSFSKGPRQSPPCLCGDTLTRHGGLPRALHLARPAGPDARRSQDHWPCGSWRPILTLHYKL